MDARTTGAPVGQEIRVLVATQSERVCDVLETRHDVKYDLVLFPDVIIGLLPEAEVIVIDYEDVGGSEADKARLQEQIFAAKQAGRIDEYTSDEFLVDPATCLEGTGGFGPDRSVRRLPSNCCIAFVSYSGGTGRTTLALDTAFCFAETLQKHAQKAKRAGREQFEGLGPTWADTMLVEMTFGVSSVAAVTGLEMPHLMALSVDKDAIVQRYRGVDLVPMDYDNVRVLAVDLLKRYFDRQLKVHRFTVVDTSWPHSLSDAIADRVDLWLVVATDRPDTVTNAHKLAEELRAEFGPDKVWLLWNATSEVRGASEQRPSRRSRRRKGSQESESAEDQGASSAGASASSGRQQELEWQVRVPRIARPDEYRGELGRAVLSQIFAPVWLEYDKARR